MPFEAGTNYTFWIVAKNRLHTSVSSDIFVLTFDGSANINNIEDLQVLGTTNHSVTLKWKKMKDVDSYQITPRAPTPYPALKSFTTMDHTFEVMSLAPGVRYIFEVCAVKKMYTGKVAMITATTNGTALPMITKLDAQLVKSQRTTVKLTWDPPKSNRKIKWRYAIHYATNMLDFFKGERIAAFFFIQ